MGQAFCGGRDRLPGGSCWARFYAVGVTLRSGTWTIVFTDVVGSTEQRVRVGDARAEELRKEHDHIVAAAASHFGGVVVKGTGDGAMAAFGSAADALGAAVLIQQRVDRRNRTAMERLGLRLGLALGDVEYGDGDLFGTPVVEAARICALADAGEILVTEVVRAVAGSRAPCEFSSRGPQDLKGLPAPVVAWEVRWAGVASEHETIGFPELLDGRSQSAFAGRRAELDVAIAAWKVVTTDGARRVVLLSGEPGIGKTRLAREAARVAHDGAAIVLYGSCNESVPSPYEPFVEVLEWYVRRSPEPILGGQASVLAQISPQAWELVGNVAELTGDAEADQFRIFSAYTLWLEALAATYPIVIVLDDLHWASRETLLLLRHLLRTIVNSSVLVLGTYRDTDLDRTRPLSSMLAELRALPGVERVVLRGLGNDDTRELLHGLSAPDVDDLTSLATAVQLETNGNPLFIGELMRHLAETGALDAAGSYPTPIGALGLPEGIHDVIGRRIERLGAQAGDVLGVASLIGRDFPADLLIEAAPTEEDVVLDVLERSLAARLIEEVGRDNYRFTHALVRAALADTITSARRIRTHRRIAEALELLRRADVQSLAFHWCEGSSASLSPQAIDYSLEAADAATRQGAVDEAVQLLGRAWGLAEHSIVDPDKATSLLIALADAHMAAGMVEAARTAYVAAASRVSDGSPELFHIALSIQGPARVETRDPRVIPLLERALACVEEDRETAIAARLHAHLSFAERAGTPLQIAEAETAVRLAEASGDPFARFDSYCSRFWTTRPTDKPWKDAVRALEAAEEIGTAAAVLEALNYAIIGEGERGNHTAFERLARRQWTLADESGLRIPRGFSRVIAARLAVRAGDLDEAERLAAEALSITDDEAIVLAWAAVHVRVHHLRDGAADAAASIRAWSDAGMIAPEVQHLMDAALSLFLAESGHTEEAVAILDELCADNLEHIAPVGNVFRLGELAVLADAASVTKHIPAATALLPALQPWVHHNAQLSVAEDLGPSTLFIAKLERVLGRSDDAIQHLEHALETLTTTGSHWRACEAQIELAGLLEYREPGRAMKLLGDAFAYASQRGLALLTRRAETASQSLRS